MLLMREIVDILHYALPKIQVKRIHQSQNIYKYINSVDAINKLVMDGKSFRESYQIIGKQIQEGHYNDKTALPHTHIGSKDNLGIDRIREKLLVAAKG